MAERVLYIDVHLTVETNKQTREEVLRQQDEESDLDFASRIISTLAQMKERT